MSFTMPKNVYCTFEKNCLGVECCVGLELSFLTKTYKIWVNIDPCSSPIKLSMGVGMNSYQFELNSNGSDSEFVKIVFPDNAFHYLKKNTAVKFVLPFQIIA